MPGNNVLDCKQQLVAEQHDEPECAINKQLVHPAQHYIALCT